VNGLLTVATSPTNSTNVAASTQATMGISSRWRPRCCHSTSTAAPANIQAQSSSEPSWPAHAAATVYAVESCRSEYAATYCTEKSRARNSAISRA
jgi:hypothetical protein